MKHHIFVGFDGFIDSLLHCVQKRISKNKCSFFTKMEVFADHIKNAAPKNMNFECVERFQSPGGNAPILARALSSLGASTFLAGSCGYPKIHPIFKPLRNKHLSLHSIANPGETDALEFDNGKIFLGKMGEILSLSIQELHERLPTLDSIIKQSSCLATVNWTMMPLVEEFWNYLLSKPSLLSHTPPIFVDLADPAKKTPQSLKKALSLLSALNKITPVILGLNLSESESVCSLLKIPFQKIPFSSLAQAIIQKLHVSTIVIHTSKEAVAATSFQNAHYFIPWTPSPFRSTGAGDTFNAGFLCSYIQNSSIEEALRTAIAASGLFVRTGIPPTTYTVLKFLSLWDKDPLLINKNFKRT